MRPNLIRVRLALLVGLASLLAPLTLIPASPNPLSHNAHLRVYVVDVGEGDCIFAETPLGHTLLIDGGGVRSSNPLGQSSESPIGERVVVPFLRSLGVGEINVLVITHPHGDHIGGLPAVVRDLKVDEVLDGTTLDYPSPAYLSLCQNLHRLNIPRLPARRGEHIDFGDGVTADVLNPPDGQASAYGLDDSDKTINNYSAVLRLAYGHTVFLLDGDAEEEAEDNMLKVYPASFLRADVLKCGHHGSRNASSDEWLATVQPRYGAISCGVNNVFGHPHSEALARLAAHHVNLFRTDLNGTIEYDSDGKTVTAKVSKG